MSFVQRILPHGETKPQRDCKHGMCPNVMHIAQNTDSQEKCIKDACLFIILCPPSSSHDLAIFRMLYLCDTSQICTLWKKDQSTCHDKVCMCECRDSYFGLWIAAFTEALQKRPSKGFVFVLLTCARFFLAAREWQETQLVRGFVIWRLQSRKTSKSLS